LKTVIIRNDMSREEVAENAYNAGISDEPVNMMLINGLNDDKSLLSRSEFWHGRAVKMENMKNLAEIESRRQRGYVLFFAAITMIEALAIAYILMSGVPQ